MKTLFIALNNIINKALMPVFFFFTLLFSQASVAQTSDFVRVGQSHLQCAFDDSKQGPCKANDLTVLDLIAGDPDNPCAVNCVNGFITLPLTMRINNTTGSVRTAFALYGTLSDGASIKVGTATATGNVFICVGPIDVTQGINSFQVGTITFPCSATTLTLSNNYLAYTPANSSTEDFCATLSGATKCADIGPKCGVSKTINIIIPVTATAVTAKEPCLGATTGGSIKVTANNGKAPYAARIYKKPAGGACSATEPTLKASDPNYVTSLSIATTGGNATTTETLAPGDYCIYVTDANGCTFLVSHTIAGQNCCISAPKPVVASTKANICQTTVTVTVCNAVKDVSYSLTSGGTTTTIKATSNGALAFTGLTPGAGFSVFGKDLVNTGCTAGPTADCNNTTVLATCPAARSDEIQTQAIKLPETLTKVKAMPNPFNDRIKFRIESAVSGQGSLDLYNMLGQKVKNVYNGHVEKGRVQNIEYSVPNIQRSNLIYIFRVGNQSTSGKLIQLK